MNRQIIWFKLNVENVWRIHERKDNYLRCSKISFRELNPELRLLKRIIPTRIRIQTKRFGLLGGKNMLQYIDESMKLLKRANFLKQIGLQKIDSLHIARAILSGCDYFLTTDDKILKRENEIGHINVADAIAFIKEVLS